MNPADKRTAFDNLDRILGVPQLPSWIEAFFDTDGPFEGALLSELPDDDPDCFNAADLCAIAWLDVVVRPRSARKLLFNEEVRTFVTSKLKTLPRDEDIWVGRTALGPNHAADSLYSFLLNDVGIGPVTTSKLLHRKRPRLIPIVDSVVQRTVAGTNADYWELFRGYLGDTDRRASVSKLRPEVGGGHVSVLRILDVAIWMSGSQGRYAKKVRGEA